MVQDSLEQLPVFDIIPHLLSPPPTPERARLGAELQQLYADGKYAEIRAPGGRLPAQRRGWQLHRKPGKIGCGARSPGLPGGEDAGDEPGRSKRRSRASWAGWRATSGPKWRTSRPRQSCRATTSTITKAFWRCSRRTEKMLAIDPARREPRTPGRVRGLGEQAGAAAGANQADR